MPNKPKKTKKTSKKKEKEPKVHPIYTKLDEEMTKQGKDDIIKSQQEQIINLENELNDNSKSNRGALPRETTIKKRYNPNEIRVATGNMAFAPIFNDISRGSNFVTNCNTRFFDLGAGVGFYPA